MFEVTVRDVDMGVGSEQVRDIVSFLESYGGFPNFFGVQRFGVMRPVNHVIGRYIVEGDFERAVMSYVANPVEGEDEEILRLRDDLERSHDFSKALSCYPESLSFEKAVLNKLVVEPRDFVAALKELPRNLLTLFVSAYQSFLFNRMLSERIRRGIPLNRAIVGDIVLPVRKNVIDDVGILVDEFNIEKVNRQVSRGKAFVSGLLVGCDPVFSEGEMGEIEHEVVERERIDVRDFTVPEIPFVSFSGSRRSLLAPLSRIDWRLMDDEFSSDRRSLILKFELRKGCYATSLLREFMKSGDVRNY
jgi:tRNA pseudouridine13 synthase